jgi:hypothetical protein
MQVTIAKEYTLLRAKLKLVLVIWPKICPTSTCKDSKRRIVGLNFVELFYGCRIGYDFVGCTIYEKGGNNESFIPKL